MNCNFFTPCGYEAGNGLTLNPNCFETMFIHRRFYLVCAFLLIAKLGFAQQSITRTYPLTDEQKISAKLKLGALKLTLAGHDAKNVFEYQYTADSPNDLHYEYDLQNGKGELLISNQKPKNQNGERKFINLGGWFSGDDVEGPANLELSLSNRVPIDLALSVGAGEHDIDLSGMKISSLALSSGACRTSIAFKKPNSEAMQKLKISTGASSLDVDGLCNANFQEFSFSGGASEVTLSYDGELQRTCKSKISVGAGSVRLVFPRNAPVKIYYDDNIFSSLDIPSGFTKKGSTYTTTAYSEAGKTIDISISSGMGAVSVEWK
jgi:hypothetical protein